MRLFRDPAKISSGCKRGYFPPAMSSAMWILPSPLGEPPTPAWPPCPASLGLCIRQSPACWGPLPLRAWPYLRSEPGVLCPQDRQQLASRTSVAVPDSPMSGRRGRGSSLPTRATFPPLYVCICQVGRGKECRLGIHADPHQTPAPPLISCVILSSSLCLSDPVFFAVKLRFFCPVM